MGRLSPFCDRSSFPAAKLLIFWSRPPLVECSIPQRFAVDCFCWELGMPISLPVVRRYLPLLLGFGFLV